MEGVAGKKIIQYLYAKKRVINNDLSIRVVSDCMSPLIRVNDVIEVKYSDVYTTGNVVAVYIKDNIYIHRIISIEDDLVITKGDKSFTADVPVDPKMIIGMVSKNITQGKILNNTNISSKLIVFMSKMEYRLFEKMKTESGHKKLKAIYYIRKYIDVLYKRCSA